MKKIIVLLIVASSICCSAQEVNIKEQVRKSATLIFSKKDNNSTQFGSGFFVIKSYMPSNQKRLFFVTAKHVIMSDGENQVYFSEMYIRLNKKGDGAEILKVRLLNNDGTHTFLIHDDPSVDIAVIPVNIDMRLYEVCAIPFDFILNKEKFKELGIQESDDIFLCGLYKKYLGNEKSMPIFRFGKFALITDEKMNFKGIPKHLYIADMYATPGNSGSPVFNMKESNNRLTRMPNIYLVGVSIGIDQSDGISFVVPSQYLYDILMNTEVGSGGLHHN